MMPGIIGIQKLESYIINQADGHSPQHASQPFILSFTDWRMEMDQKYK